MSETAESYYNKDADATSAHRKIVAFIRGHVSKMVPSFWFWNFLIRSSFHHSRRIIEKVDETIAKAEQDQCMSAHDIVKRLNTRHQMI